jgi:hypothetical protein
VLPQVRANRHVVQDGGCSDASRTSTVARLKMQPATCWRWGLHELLLAVAPSAHPLRTHGA